MNRKYRKSIIAGNWKMNKLPSEARPFVDELRGLLPKTKTCDTVLCVPYFLYGKTLSSVEFISEDGGKCSLKGGRMRGAYWAPDGLADEVRARGRVAVAEGLATALSVSQAAEIPCVSARSCSGLMSTAESLRRRFRKAERFVCSDIGNGEKQAREAARATGAKIAKPDFEERLIERFRALTGSNDAPTDFNDFYLARGDI